MSTRNVMIMKNAYNSLTFNEKVEFLYHCHAPGFFDKESLNEKLGMISLIVSLTVIAKKKIPSYTCKDTLYKILNDDINQVGRDVVDNIASLCEIFLPGVVQVNFCGHKDPKHMAQTIKQLLLSYCPF